MVAVRDCAQVKPGENVLVVTDTLHPPEIAEALCAAANSLGAESAMVVMPQRESGGGEQKKDWEPRVGEPIKPVAAAMKEADMVFTLTNPYLLGSQAQDEALAAGTRLMGLMYFDRFEDRTHMIADEIANDFIRMMAVDIPAMNSLTERVAQAIQEASEARLFSEKGTDLEIKQAGNLVAMLGGVVREMGEAYKGASKGKWAHSPAGVMGVVPANANGTVVCDVSMVPIGHVKEPIRFTIENRRIVEIEGGVEARWLMRYLESFKDPNVYNCPAEWGVGTNPGAIMSGKFLEEEVLYGVPHTAMGDDTRFHNGTTYAPFHSDIMFSGASLELDGRLVLEKGKFLIES